MRNLIGITIVLAAVLAGSYLLWRHQAEAETQPSGEAGHADAASHAEAAEPAKEPAGHDHADHGAEHGTEEGLVTLTEEQQKANGVEVAAAGPGTLAVQLALPGEIALNADRVAHVVPRVPGVVREVSKNLGQDVKTGELMAVLDSRELATLKAEYLSACERQSLAQATFEREKGLWEKKISAEQDYLTAKQALAEAGINTRKAEQQLHSVGFADDTLKGIPGRDHASYTRYEIAAPLDGTVIEKHITIGESLKDDASCFTIADLSTVWAKLNVYQKDIAAVREGQGVLISDGGASEEGVRGTIDYLGPIVGEETRTASARVVLQNADRHWRPGQFVTGYVAAGQQEAAVVIPKTALQTVEKVASVFVEDKEGFRVTPVTVGRTTDTHAEVVDGLSAGQRYAVTGSFVMKAMLEKGEAACEH